MTDKTPESKLKKAFYGAAVRVKNDFGRNLVVAGVTTAGWALILTPAAPAVALFGGLFFASENLVSGAVGAYKSLKGPKP